MNAIEAFAKYAKECGVDAQVDGLTLIQNGDRQIKLNDLKNNGTMAGSVGYHINLRYPWKIRDKDKDRVSLWDILPTENGAFFVFNGAVILYVGIYEIHAIKRRGMLVSITGHEETAVVSLLQIEDSYTYCTR